MPIITDAAAEVAKVMLGHWAPPPEPKARRWSTPGRLARTLDPTTVQTPALDLIDRELIAMAEGENDRLIICMPPQEGKSERVSHRFAEWLLEHDHDLRIAIVSYADEIARRWGADIKLDAETHDGTESTVDLGLTLRPDSKAAGRWQIKDGRGGVYCTGVGGSLTGKPVDWMIIDDPIKDLEQAQSTKYRERARRFWRSVAVPRLGPGSKCVVIQTRWHEDDVAGWLQAEQPGRWRVISISAIAEDDEDPLGRKPGEPMISARGDRDWDQIRRDVGEFVWAALYQQRPTPAAGGMFKRKALRYWHWAPTDPYRSSPLGGIRIDLGGGKVVYPGECWRFMTVDLAASERTSADYTAAAVWLITIDGDLIMVDGDSGRIEERDHWSIVRPLYEKWAVDTVFVESRMFGTTLVIDAVKSGVPISELRAETDKVTRALPLSARCDQGRFWLPAADTATLEVRDVVDQLVQFPNAVHDDWVDTASYAGRVVIAHWTSGSRTNGHRTAPERGRAEVSRAFTAQVGGGAEQFDPSTSQW